MSRIKAKFCNTHMTGCRGGEKKGFWKEKEQGGVKFITSWLVILSAPCLP